MTLTPHRPDFGSPDPERTVVDLVIPSSRPLGLRRVGTVRTLCPRKNMGVVIDTASGENVLFAIEDIAPADRSCLREDDLVSYVAVAGPDGLSARQLQRDSADIPPPPSEILMARGWR